MSASSIARAANDQQLIQRVIAMTQKEVIFNDDLANTEYGKQIAAGSVNVLPLIWGVAVDTEAAYESALMAGRGSPGYDSDVITDAALTSAITAHWPYADGEGPQVPPP